MKDRNAYEAEFDAMIREYGWGVQAVFASEDGPGFAYTVGLARKGLPEIIVFGLPPEAAHPFLNQLGRRFETEGVPALDVDLFDVAEGYPARLLPVSRSAADEYMFATKHRYPGYSAVQLVWCDKHRHFPWDPAFPDALRGQQPILRNNLH